MFYRHYSLIVLSGLLFSCHHLYGSSQFQSVALIKRCHLVKPSRKYYQSHNNRYHYGQTDYSLPYRHHTQRHGSGRYSTSGQAKQALVSSFRWNEHYRRPQLNALAARPSFCSSAVWVATLSALLQWEEKNRRRVISPEAWQALLPHLEKDGIGPWGYANANGPGFALLVHKLGAGFSFTDWKKARPSDVLKIWWNDHIGGQERGHIVILVKDEGDTACVWSSHMEKDGQPGGYGIRRYPKSAMKRVLFTRITQPAAFNRASKLPDDPWLTRLMTENTTWAECVRRCGIWH